MRESYFVSQDKRLQRRLRSDFPHQAIFLGSDGTAELPIPGTYTLRVDVFHFEPDSTLDVDVTILGQVHGLAGTDTQRRDLMLPLLWGTPIALTFGLIAAIATSVGGMFVAAIAAWYGGVVDRVIQFLTDVNLILPFFPVSLMIFILYSKSIITILAVTVALTIFGSSVKTYRATFLQVKNATYVEAARAYGASDWRIVVRYMIPKIMTVLLPKLIILVPSYVFLEATLAFLGVTDPILPTWGKLIVAALSYGIHRDAAHIVIAPLSLLFITGFAFAMVGIALEQVFDPRLREANL
ncbi:MAG: ABC transporter permease [Chloroflexi bacterium]|nr:ABC transporter permease [Chloroflexota bacterium]